MSKEVWLSVEEVCELTGEVKETVRRKCKREEYTSIFKKEGKFKTYSILLESLPENIKNKYYGIKASANHSKFYKNAPAWAKKQAQKYITLFEQTKGMKHQEIVQFLKAWNKNHPDKKSSYSSLCRAKVKYEQFGEDALLSQKGLNKNKYSINPEYYEYYKNLYLSSEAPSAASCWASTLSYALRTSRTKVPYFPCEKTFIRFLKKEMSDEAIKYARAPKEFVFAKDYSNINANEYWYVESYQFKFPIKFKNRTCYPWITVVKDIKTSKWLGYFLYPNTVNSNHITQAIYYALIKYGLPKKIFAGKTHFDSYINTVGKTIKTDICCYDIKIRTTLFDMETEITDEIPQSLKIKPIDKDLKTIETPDKNIDLYKFKNYLDNYINETVNKKAFRTKSLFGKSPDILWKENYKKNILPNKQRLIHLCMCNENPVKVGRNGVYDSFTGKNYWGEWMFNYIGGNVYIRRDIYSDDIGYVMSAKDRSGIGYVEVLPKVAALWRTKDEREVLRKEMARRKKMLKVARSYVKVQEISIGEKVENYIRAYEGDKPIKDANVKLVKFGNTKMEEVLKKARQQKEDRETAERLLSQLAENL